MEINFGIEALELADDKEEMRQKWTQSIHGAPARRRSEEPVWWWYVV
jgi:hypothetical protein